MVGVSHVDFRINPPLDPFVLLDASILLAALTPVRLADGRIDHRRYPAHADARTFLTYAANQALAGSVILVITELAIEECAHHITTQAIVRDIHDGVYPGAVSSDWNRLYKSQPGVVRRYTPVVTRFITAVRAAPIVVLGPAELYGIRASLPVLMVTNMERYELLAADAYHLAVAEAMGIGSVATLDGDWLRADAHFTVLINR